MKINNAKFVKNLLSISTLVLLLIASAHGQIQSESTNKKTDTPAHPQVVKAEENVEPLSYRAMRLGITISEFKALDSNIFSRSESKLIPVCLGDREIIDKRLDNEFYQYGYDKQLDVIICKYVITSRKPGRVQEIGFVGIGNYATDNYEFKFIRKNESEPYVLFSINLFMHINAYKDVLGGMNEKYGYSRNVTKADVQNRLGGRFENITTIWENEKSKATLLKYAGSLDQSVLLYEFLEYSRFITDKVKEFKKIEASKV